jgi:hypothetical protein
MKEWFAGKTISVVGNAASLLSQSYGAEIDKSEVVVRLNRGGYKFNQYTKNMGSRIDVWCMQNANQNRTYFNKPHNRHAKKMQMDTIDISPNYIDLVDLVYTIEDRLELEKNLSKKASTGLRVLHYIHKQAPQKVNVYGFDWKKTFSWHEKRGCVAHNFEEERNYCMNYIFSEGHFVLRR